MQSNLAVNKYMHTFASCWISSNQNYDARNYKYKIHQRDIPCFGLWSILITSSDRIIAKRLASVLRLPASFTHVIMCTCHCFGIKVYETVSFLRIVTQLVTNPPMSYCSSCIHPLLRLHILGHKNPARLITKHSCQVFLKLPSPLCQILARVYCCLQIYDFINILFLLLWQTNNR